MLVIVCPGQGAQSPGFLTSWLDRPGFRDRLGWFSAAADLDLVAHGTVSDAETIKDTAVAQPLIVAAGLAALDEILPEGARVGAVAGHSVGEITAAAVSGVLTPEQALVFVRERGRGMARAAAVTPTGMAAIVRGEPDAVLAGIEAHHLTPANMNGAGQIVAAGALDDLAALRADPPAGARVIPLKVAGAFHTDHMAPAQNHLAELARGVHTADPAVPVLSNADGEAVATGAELLHRLVAQVALPVRWDLCMETLAGLGVTGILELPPAGTLTNLAKRALPGVETLAVKGPDDLDAAHDFVARHQGAPHD